MAKKEKRVLSAVASAALAFGCSSSSLAQPPTGPVRVTQPNIITILADDLSDSEVGCYGGTEINTPNIDSLAAEGMLFRKAWATPLCTPSRVLLLTGQYGFRTGWCNLMGWPYTPKPETPQRDFSKVYMFPRSLQQAGYATALSGKWQLPGKVPTLIYEAGFDSYMIWPYKYNFPAGTEYTGDMENKQATSRFWHPGIMQDGKYVPTKPEDYGPDLHTDYARRFIREHKDEPFFLHFSAVQPHTPWKDTPDPAHPGQRIKGSFKSNVEYLDYLVGQILDELRTQGLTERTVIIFAGDNGSALNQKGKLTERGVRVPFIVSAPGRFQQGVVSDALVDFSDIAATVLDIAGAAPPDGVKLDGQSLVPVLRGDAGATGRPWIFSFLTQGRLIRDQQYMLVDPGPDQPIRFFATGPTAMEDDDTDLTDSTDPEVVAAKQRLLRILETLPRPELTEDTIPPKPAKKAPEPQPAAAP